MRATFSVSLQKHLRLSLALSCRTRRSKKRLKLKQRPGLLRFACRSVDFDVDFATAEKLRYQRTRSD